jgi:putative ABC transport system permease protein
MLSTLGFVQDTAASGTATYHLTWLNLVLAGGLILIAIAISLWQGLGLTRSFVVGAIRTVVQLLVVGYILVYIFELERWYLVLAALLVMLAAAATTAVGRVRRGRRRELIEIASVALLIGSGLTLIYVMTLVVHVTPWYSPRYLIPFFGMIVGNAMNAASLAAERLAGEMEDRSGEVEAYLALGASPQTAAREPVRLALRAALIPTINGLMVVGLVTLPGLMTGQILAGESPLTAVRYQIAIMFMLAAASAITAVVVALRYRKAFFTAAEQLRMPAERGR